jgi:hypothetical protein
VSRRIRIELDREGARALHAALTAKLAADAVDADQIAAARGVLDQLDRRVPDWVADDPSQAVLAALADAEAQGRGALAEEELVAALGAGGTSIRPVLDRMVEERLVQRTERDGRVRSRGLLEPAEANQLALTDEGAALARERWAAISPTPHWRIPAPPLPYRPLPVQVQPSDQACPSEACDGRATWVKAGGRTATWRALTRDGSVEWTCPSCSRTWLVYLQACTHDGAPAYRDPVDGDHNRPYWRSGR